MFFSLSARAEITLAVIAPKAGEYVKEGNELFRGAKLAVKEINDNGGLLGQKLDVLTIDDRCDDRLAVSTAEMLSLLNSKDVKLVVGPYCSNSFETISEIYEKAGIFQIIPTTVAYNTASTEKRGQLLLLGTKSQMSADFFQFYNRNFAGLKTAFVYNDKPENGYAEVAKSLSTEFRRYGKADLLKFYTLNNADESMKDLSRTIVKDGMNIVLVLGEGDETVSLINAVRKKSKNIIIFSSKRIFSPQNFEKLSKDAAEGIYLLDVMGLKDSLLFTENLVNLRLLGIEPEGLEVYAYVSVKLWGQLVEKVKSFSYGKLSKMANSKEMQEDWSEFLMHSGSIKSAQYIIEEYRNGGFKQVY
jgi:branched-chain amino acid transport system substrate-binding protein